MRENILKRQLYAGKAASASCASVAPGGGDVSGYLGFDGFCWTTSMAPSRWTPRGLRRARD